MKNIVVLTRERPSKAQIMALVEELGGHWQEERTLDNGVIEAPGRTRWTWLGRRRESPAIYVDYYEDGLDDYEPEEIEAVQRLSGTQTPVAVGIHIGHDPGSDELARKFSSEILRRWGGFVDDTMQELR